MLGDEKWNKFDGSRLSSTRANFFVAQVKLARGPIPRRAFGVIGRVLLLSFANVLALPFATR